MLNVYEYLTPKALRRAKESNPQPEGWHGFQVRLSTIGCCSPLFVGKMGVEPTCYRLPFLLLIRQRGYIPICSWGRIRTCGGELTRLLNRQDFSTKLKQPKNIEHGEGLEPPILLLCRQLALPLTHPCIIPNMSMNN